MIQNFINSSSSSNVGWIEIKQKSSKTPNEIKTAERKNKRLVIILEENIPKFDSYEFREKINSALKTVKYDVQITTIIKISWS